MGSETPVYCRACCSAMSVSCVGMRGRMRRHGARDVYVTLHEPIVIITKSHVTHLFKHVSIIIHLLA